MSSLARLVSNVIEGLCAGRKRSGEMFKVKHKKYGTILRVYATETDKHGSILFLFYDGEWSWRDSVDYYPY